MPIDASIPLSVQPLKLESPTNQLAMMGNAMKIGEMQRDADTQNKLREIYTSGGDLKSPEVLQKIYAVSPEAGMKFEQNQANLNKATNEGKKLSGEITLKNLDIMRERSKDMIGNLSNENFIAHTQENVRDGLISPETAQRAIQAYTAIPFNERKAYIMQNLSKAEDLAKNAETQRHNKTSEGIAAGHLAVSQDRLKQETATGALTPQTTDLLAQTFIKTGQMPPMGMGSKAAGMRQAVLNRAAELSMGGGKSSDGTVAPAISAEEAAANIVQNKSSLIGNRASERTLGTNLANIVAAGSEAEKMIGIAENYATKINPTDFPVINAAGNYVAKNSGDPVQAGLATSLNSLVNAYARAINPKGVATVSDKTHAREVIDAKMSSGQFKEVFNVMRQEMQAAQAAPEEARAKIRGTNGRETPSAKKISSDADYNALPSGAEFIAPDGSHRRKP